MATKKYIRVGFVKKEVPPSLRGSCRVCDNAQVCGDALVFDKDPGDLTHDDVLVFDKDPRDLGLDLAWVDSIIEEAQSRRRMP